MLKYGNGSPLVYAGLTQTLTKGAIAVNHFTKLFDAVILGTLVGFDRVVFQGRLLPLNFSDGAQFFFDRQGILYKHARQWMQDQTERLVGDVEDFSRRMCGRGIENIASTALRKDDIARKRQADEQIRTGLIGAYKCLEQCTTFKIKPDAGRPRLVPHRTRCNHVYLYFDHPTYGFMYVRLQTYFPYMIQVSMNGREWLARELANRGIGFEKYKNKITACDDFAVAQQILDAQAFETEWVKTLDAFPPTIFPSMPEIVGPDVGYTWYAWQSEWATDVLFADQAGLRDRMESLLRYAFLTGTVDKVIRFLDKATNRDGKLRANANADVMGRFMRFGDGARVRFWVNGNSVKAYNQLNVLRVETTVNRPGEFKFLREVGESREVKMAPIRKSVQDMSRRANVSDNANNRVLESLAAVEESGSDLQTVLKPYGRSKTRDGRRVRALDPFGKDRAILQAVCDPEFLINGFNNASIRERLKSDPRFKGKSDKQLAEAVTRAFRLLRDHGLMRKFPNQHRYVLNTKGVELTTALQAALHANVKELTKTAA